MHFGTGSFLARQSRVKAVGKEEAMVETKIFRLKDISRSFATRMRGQEAIKHLYETLQATNTEKVMVDWRGVSAASPSFIDEFVGAVCGAIQRGYLNNRDVIFTGEDHHIIELIDTILQRRGCLIEYALNPE